MSKLGATRNDTAPSEGNERQQERRKGKGGREEAVSEKTPTEREEMVDLMKKEHDFKQIQAYSPNRAYNYVPAQG